MTVHVLVSVEIPSEDYEEALDIATSEVLAALPLDLDAETGSPESFGYETPSK